MKTKINTQQEHIKVLQQLVLKGHGGMELLIDMREKMQKRIDQLEERISETSCSNTTGLIEAEQFVNFDKLELEFCKINARLFDGKNFEAI